MNFFFLSFAYLSRLNSFAVLKYFFNEIRTVKERENKQRRSGKKPFDFIGIPFFITNYRKGGFSALFSERSLAVRKAQLRSRS